MTHPSARLFGRKAAFLVASSLGAVLVAMPVSASAQAAGEDGPTKAQVPATNEDQLDDIVVTAQKRAENLQDVPVAVVAATGDQLRAAGVVDTQSLKVAFAGVNIRSTSSYFQPSIRGISTSSINVENPVALYVDGVYYASQRDAQRDFNDIDQVAILKGPQGTLFGRNATGGVIQISTRNPSHDARGEIGASIDNYATLRSDLYFTGGLSDSVAASLSGSFVTQANGWGRNITTGKDTFKIYHNFSLRGKLLFDGGPSTRVLLIADYMDRRDSLGAYFRPFPGTGPGLGGYIPTKSVYDSSEDVDSRNAFAGGGGSATITQRLGFADLTSITAYRKNRTSYTLDADMVPTPNYSVYTQAQQNTFTQELQLVSPGKQRFNWTIGAFYYHNNYYVDPQQVFLGGIFAPLPTSSIHNVTRGAERTDSIAPFAQGDFELFSRTRLTLGARWTYERRVYDGSITADLKNGASNPSVIPPVTGATITFRKPTWRISLDHRFSDEVLAYASYNRGFKSGGFNVANPRQLSYQPEQLDAYEIGIKTEILDHRLRINTAGFYYKYRNIQVVQFLNRLNTIINGAGAELYGLDVDAEAQLAPGLRLTVGFELLHTDFTSFPNAGLSAPLPAGGVSVLTGDASGRRLPLAQNFNGNVGLEYSTPVGAGKASFGITLNHNSKYFFESDNYTFQPSYDLINANVAWTSPGERLTVGLFVRNLLDKRVISQASALSGIGYATTYDNPPRIYGASARVRF